jgi:hypothetical protein
VMLEEPPGATVLGSTCKVTSGAELVTVTVVDWLEVPPGPLHIKPYSVVFVSLPVDQVPLVANGALQPPVAVHCPAFSVVQVRVELLPLAIVVGEAVSVIVGAA